MKKELNKDIAAMQAILGNGTDKLSPLGHKLQCDSGKIDVAILTGIDSLGQIAVKVGKSTSSKKTRNSMQARADRVKNHVNWMARTSTTSEGMVTHLEKVYGPEAKKIGKLIAINLRNLAVLFNESYRVKYGKKASVK